MASRKGLLRFPSTIAIGYTIEQYEAGLKKMVTSAQ